MNISIIKMYFIKICNNLLRIKNYNYITHPEASITKSVIGLLFSSYTI